MNKIEDYPFWDLIAEEAYEPNNQKLKKGTLKNFETREKHKNIYLFGCNDASRLFIKKFKDEYKFAGVFDNAKDKWGTFFEELEVMSPRDTIPKLSKEEDVIVVAMRLNADAVADQLDSLGFCNYYGLGVLVSGMYPYFFCVEKVKDLKKNHSIEDIIMIESTNDFDGNSGALYEYLKKNDSKHKFVWVLKEEANKKLLCDLNDVALCPRKSIDDLEEYVYYRAVSKWQIWDNHPIRKVREEQINIFLQHFGMGYKQIANIFTAPQYVDYVLTPNESVYEYEKHALLYAANTKIIFGELPRNDVLYSTEWRELEKLTLHKFDKIIMWAPTLRDSKLYNRKDTDIEYPFGISVIYTEDEMKRLNKFLEANNMLLLIKIHPRQKCNYIDGTYSNILYMDGNSVKQVHPYKLMTQVDAMITDYSSMVFDYMLLDRPIAWALEDMEHYRVPFLMENPLDFMPGEKIYTVEELLIFLAHVKDGEDIYRDERNILSERFNAPKQGKGCENIVKILGL